MNIEGMDATEFAERTDIDYLKMVEKDMLESGLEQTSLDYKACRLKIKLLSEEILTLRKVLMTKQ